MNHGNTDEMQARTAHSGRLDEHELSKAKRELLQAEVRLAKARATVVAAEIDIKVASAKLRSFAK